LRSLAAAFTREVPQQQRANAMAPPSGGGFGPTTTARAMATAHRAPPHVDYVALLGSLAAAHPFGASGYAGIGADGDTSLGTPALRRWLRADPTAVLERLGGDAGGPRDASAREIAEQETARSACRGMAHQRWAVTSGNNAGASTATAAFRARGSLSALWQQLALGRCDTISGPGGAGSSAGGPPPLPVTDEDAWAAAAAAWGAAASERHAFLARAALQRQWQPGRGSQQAGQLLPARHVPHEAWVGRAGGAMRAAMGGGRHATTAGSPAERESNVAAAGASAELEEAEAAGRLRRCFRYVGGVQLSPEGARRVLFAVRACGHVELTLPPAAAAAAAAAAVAPSWAGAQAAASPGAGGPVVFGVAFRVWLRDAEHAMIATAVATASLAVVAKAAVATTGQQQQPPSGHSEEREEGEGGLAVVRRMHALLDTALATAAAAPPSGPRQAPGNGGSNIGARPWLGLDAMDGDVWMDDAQVRQLCARLAVAGIGGGGDYRYSYSLTHTYSTLASCTPPVCILVAGCCVDFQ